MYQGSKDLNVTWSIIHIAWFLLISQKLHVVAPSTISCTKQLEEYAAPELVQWAAIEVEVMSKISIRYRKQGILYQTELTIVPHGDLGGDENGIDENAEPGAKQVGVESWELRVESWELRIESWKLKIESWELKIESWELRIESWEMRVESWELRVES